MAKQKSTPAYVTREILKEEISASEKRLTVKIGEEISGVEKRLTVKIGEEISGDEKRLTATLDSKIEGTSQSLKDYSDSRFTQLDTMITQLDRKISQTMKGYQKDILHVLSNHEDRITVLEGRGPQPNRI